MHKNCFLDHEFYTANVFKLKQTFYEFLNHLDSICRNWGWESGKKCQKRIKNWLKVTLRIVLHIRKLSQLSQNILCSYRNKDQFLKFLQVHFGLYMSNIFQVMPTNVLPGSSNIVNSILFNSCWKLKSNTLQVNKNTISHFGKQLL